MQLKSGFGLTFVAVFLAILQAPYAASEAPKPAPCSSPEYHQFDFWLGDWDAFDVDKPEVKVAHNRVDLILDGCVLREDYEGTDGHHGESFTIYDASRKVWHQTWVTNRGELLTIEGAFQNGEMVLSGEDLTNDGKPRQVRGVWKPENGNVRETAFRSLDRGKTWQPWFDMTFRQLRSQRPRGLCATIETSLRANTNKGSINVLVETPQRPQRCKRARSFDCVVVRCANHNSAQDDRGGDPGFSTPKLRVPK